MTTFNNNGLPTQFGFLLLNDFTLLSLSAAVEPLRMANRICGQEHYTWRTFSETGGPATSSGGIVINVESSIENTVVLETLDAVIVCGGNRVEKNTSEAVLKWLRVVSRKGISLGAICTGSYVLARAGLLDGYRCSVHWENMAALADLFPEVAVSRSLYTIDRNRYTSSGGASPMDMMLYFISIQCGFDVGSGAADRQLRPSS